MTPGQEGRGRAGLAEESWACFVFHLIFALYHLQNTLKVMYGKHRGSEQFRCGSCGQSFEFKGPDIPTEIMKYIES